MTDMRDTRPTGTSRRDAPAAKPRPVPTPTSQPFWDGLAAGEVRLQQCASCGSWVYYPRNRCPACLSDRLDWKTVSGHGRVYTYTTTMQPTMPAFADEVPQNIVVVELDEGVHVTSTLVNAGERDIEVGAAVEPVFDRGDDGLTLLRFRLQ